MSIIQVEQVRDPDTWRTSVFGRRSRRVLTRSLSAQDLLRGPEGEVVQRDAQSPQLLLTGVQHGVIHLQVTRSF